MADRIDDNRTIQTDRTLPPERTALQERVVSQFESGRDLITQRYIPETRLPMEARQSERLLENTVADNSGRYLPEIRLPLAERAYNRILETVSNSGASVSNNTEPITYQQSLFNTYDPMSRTAGSGLNASGGISVIPGGDIQSGNSNTLLIFLVIIAGVGLGYWYYKKGGFSNAV